MESSAQSDAQGGTALSQAIDRLWVRFLPEIKERIAVIQVAADALAAGTIITSRREAAYAAAHKLAGVLGTFGLTRGTVLARELEINFSREDSPDPVSGKKLAAIAAELRAMVESRQSGAEPE
jgi:HPt (histidine-containing phosphotransfer) domain-containing protein